MKFNLKNCPDSPWKKGFGKELKKWVESRHCIDSAPCHAYFLMREVLGE